MKHSPAPQPFQDNYELGQLVLGRIQAEISGSQCLDAALTILSPKYTNEAVLAGRIATLRRNLTTYRRAMDLQAFWAEPITELSQ